MPKLWKWNGQGMYGLELQVLMWVFIWANRDVRWKNSKHKHIGKLSWFYDPYWKIIMHWHKPEIGLPSWVHKIKIGYEIEARGWCVQLRTDRKKWRHPRKFFGPVSWYKL